MTTKVCSVCGKEKDLSEFRVDPRKKDKLLSACGPCLSERVRLSTQKNKNKYWKTYYEKNKEKVAERIKKYRCKNKEKVHQLALKRNKKDSQTLNNRYIKSILPNQSLLFKQYPILIEAERARLLLKRTIKEKVNHT